MTNIFSTNFKVQRLSSKKEFKSYQILYKYYKFLNFTLFKREIDREDVPRHVLIQYTTMGDWRGWKSKFYEYL